MNSFSIAGLVPRTVQECTANSSVTDDAPPLTRLDTLRRRSVVGAAALHLLTRLPANCRQGPIFPRLKIFEGSGQTSDQRGIGVLRSASIASRMSRRWLSTYSRPFSRVANVASP